MNAVYTYLPGQRLAWLAERLVRIDKPYLITGSQATYQYHRWLTPLENLVTLQVHAMDKPAWRLLAGDGCGVFEKLPTTAQLRTMPKALVLDPTLEPGRYQRRHGERGRIRDAWQKRRARVHDQPAWAHEPFSASTNVQPAG